MRMSEIFENEETDRQYRQEALRYWVQVKNAILEKIYRIGGVPRDTGGYGSNLSDIFADIREPIWSWDDLVVVLSRHPRLKGELSAQNGLQRLTLYWPQDILVRYDRDSISKKINDMWRLTFLHEMIHYFDNKRWQSSDFINRHWEKLEKVPADQKTKHYVSSPHESNAFYHMVADIASELWAGHTGDFKSALADLSKQEIEDGVTIGELMDSFLTPSYRRAWLKRLTNLYDAVRMK